MIHSFHLIRLSPELAEILNLTLENQPSSGLWSSGQMLGFKLSYLFTKRHEDEIELMAGVFGYMLTSTGWVFVWG